MKVEWAISLLVLGFTIAGSIVYCHWKRVRERDKELSDLLVLIVQEIQLETRERAGYTLNAEEQV